MALGHRRTIPSENHAGIRYMGGEKTLWHVLLD